jgi:hypothetical protein
MANLPSPDTFRYSPIRLMELSCSSFDLLEHISLLGRRGAKWTTEKAHMLKYVCWGCSRGQICSNTTCHFDYLTLLSSRGMGLRRFNMLDRARWPCEFAAASQPASHMVELLDSR